MHSFGGSDFRRTEGVRNPVSPYVRYVRVHDGVNSGVHDGVNTFSETEATYEAVKFQKKFGRQPAGVNADIRLDHAAARVHAGMAALERGGIVTTGLRKIAKYSAVPYQKVAQYIQQLAGFGYVEITKANKGKRQSYRLLSCIFPQRQAGNVPVGNPTGYAATPPGLRACLRCQAQCKGLSRKTGWCRTCVKDSTMEQKYRGAKLHLGATATHDEIVKHLRVESDSAEWLRIARRLERAA